MFVKKSIENTLRIFPQTGRQEYLRLDMNENPVGLPSEFVESVKEYITPELLSRYPEQDIFLEKYSKFIGRDFNEVLATNGSDNAIRYLLQLFAKEQGEVLTVSPTFEMYRVNCNIFNLKHVYVDYNSDLTINSDLITSKINSNTNIVVLLNPNNPIGNVYTIDEVKKVLNKAKENNAMVIIDEAYHYFHNETFLNLIDEYDNILVLRTFSKLLSIAGLRLGVIIGNRHLISLVNKIRLTFEVNSIALLFGEKLVENEDLIKNLIENEYKGRQYIIGFLKRNKYSIKYGEGNYVFIEPKISPDLLANHLKNQMILVKTFSNQLLKNYIRISTGDKNSMKQFAKVLIKVDR